MPISPACLLLQVFTLPASRIEGCPHKLSNRFLLLLRITLLKIKFGLGDDGEKFATKKWFAFVHDLGYEIVVNAKQKKTLAMILEKPTRSDMRYEDVKAVLIASGAICRDGKGSRVRFEKGSNSVHLHKPHPAKVLPKYSVDLIREFLLESGGIMKNVLQYNGYTGGVAFDADDKTFHGRVLGIRAIIGFEGTTVEDLESDFHAGIDDYLDMCAEKHMEPEKPFKGTFNIRLDSSLHQRLVTHAMDEGKTLNSFIKDTLEKAVSETRA